ncbi:MAG: hypothetical protein PHQ62_01080 [Clostridia bacterium]|nr:hypothetical protein [Clostridia bacterium]
MRKFEEIIQGKFVYNNVSLSDVAEQFGTPLKLVFLDLIEKRVCNLKTAFNTAIKNESYKGKCLYLNANKANYSSDMIFTASKFSDGIETSSFYDLLFTKKLLQSAKKVLQNKVIFCNGYKQKDYINEIVKMSEKGYNITNIVDSLAEFEELIKSKINKPLKIGVRINLESLYHDENEETQRDRFGLTKDELRVVLEKLKTTKTLVFTTVHFHQRGFSFEQEKFYKNLEIAFAEYFIPMKKQFKTIVNFDIGGGTPLPANSDFDYNSWASGIIKYLKNNCKKFSVNEPNILLENGKYTVKDSMVNIYKVIGEKNTDSKFAWRIVDGSLLIAMPEYFALGEEIKVEPLNLLDNEKIRSKLAGLTCDCDDVYFDKSLGHIDLPKILQNQNLFIGVLGTGSYQDSMSGRNGVHHCLMPEEKRVLTFFKNGKRKFVVDKELQTPQDIYKSVKLNARNLKKFF